MSEYVNMLKSGDKNVMLSPVGECVSMLKSGDKNVMLSPVGECVSMLKSGDKNVMLSPVGQYVSMLKNRFSEIKDNLVSYLSVVSEVTLGFRWRNASSVLVCPSGGVTLQCSCASFRWRNASSVLECP